MDIKTRQNSRFPVNLLPVLWSVTLLCGSPRSGLAWESDSETPPRLSPGWNVLLKIEERSSTPTPLPEGSLLRAVQELKFRGPHVGHPFLLGEFETNGTWQIVNRELLRTGGENALLELPEVENFDVEGSFASDRLGGMLFLFGWTPDNSGYVLYNPTMKTKASGSPWQLCRVEKGEFVEGEDREVARQEWSGVKSIRWSINEGQLSLTIGVRRILRDLPLPDYQRGKVMFGTYNTRYGPKSLRVRSLRIREIPPPEETSSPPAESPR